MIGVTAISSCPGESGIGVAGGWSRERPARPASCEAMSPVSERTGTSPRGQRTRRLVGHHRNLRGEREYHLPQAVTGDSRDGPLEGHRPTSDVAPVSAWNWTESDEPPPPNLLLRVKSLRTVAELRSELAPARRAGRRIGLVPTMGALHEGHLSLIRAAREDCDVVVVSLFVNPAQFNEASDLERYPRSEARDSALAAEAGADILFAPSVEEVYPAGFSSAVEVLGVTRAPRGRGPRSRALPGCHDGRRQAARHGAARRGLLRAEGCPAGDRDPPPGRRT